MHIWQLSPELRLESRVCVTVDPTSAAAVWSTTSSSRRVAAVPLSGACDSRARQRGSGLRKRTVHGLHMAWEYPVTYNISSVIFRFYYRFLFSQLLHLVHPWTWIVSIAATLLITHNLAELSDISSRLRNHWNLLRTVSRGLAMNGSNGAMTEVAPSQEKTIFLESSPILALPCHSFTPNFEFWLNCWILGQLLGKLSKTF